MNLETRFLSKVARDEESGCWVWLASRSPNGYGKFWFRGRLDTAHRAAFEIFDDPIPEGLELDHLCRNRSCVNPAHLEPVTQVENMRRGEGLAAVHGAKTACVHGHAFDAENTYLRPTGGRACRACRRERNRARNVID